MKRLFHGLAILAVALSSAGAEIFDFASTHPNSRVVINQLYPGGRFGTPPAAPAYLYWYARSPMPSIRFGSVDVAGRLVGTTPSCFPGGHDEFAYVADVTPLVGQASVGASPGLLVAMLMSLVPDPSSEVVRFEGAIQLTEGIDTRALFTVITGRDVKGVSFDLLLAPKEDAFLTEHIHFGDQFWVGNSLVLVGEWMSHTAYEAASALPAGSHVFQYAVARTTNCANAYALAMTLSSAPLTADAGPDQTVECGGLTNVILDASRSTPGRAYEWYEGDVLLGSGQILPVSLGRGTHEVTLHVSGDGKLVTDTVTITVQDTIPPRFTAPADVTLLAEGQSCASLLFQKPEHGLDSCSGKLVYVDSDAPRNGIYRVGQTVVTWTATDEAGNTTTDTQTVTVLDETPPRLSCPASVTVDTAPNTCLAQVNYQVSADDECGVTIAASPASGSWFPPGITPVNVIATDASGNTATCTFDVIVRDIEPPTITAAADVRANTNSGVCNATVCPGIPTFNDNCPGTTLTSSRADGPFPLGTTEITWIATDRSGNAASATQRVHVADDQAPAITGLAVDKPQLSPPNGQLVDVTVNYQVLENCGGTTTDLRVTSNETLMKGDTEVIDDHHVRLRADRAASGTGRVYTITVRTTDANGRSSEQSVQVVVPKGR